MEPSTSPAQHWVLLTGPGWPTRFCGTASGLVWTGGCWLLVTVLICWPLSLRPDPNSVPRVPASHCRCAGLSLRNALLPLSPPQLGSVPRAAGEGPEHVSTRAWGHTSGADVLLEAPGSFLPSLGARGPACSGAHPPRQQGAQAVTSPFGDPRCSWFCSRTPCPALL